MKRRLLITVLLLAVVSTSHSSDGKSINESLVGFWHEIPDVPAGWAETYTFYADGTYIYHTNTMLCSRRLLSVKGAWNHRGNTLMLIQKEKVHLVGGVLEKAYGSCFDENELVGATRKVSDIYPNTVETENLEKFEKDSRFDGFLSNKITINGKSYWKFSDDPNYRQ